MKFNIYFESRGQRSRDLTLTVVEAPARSGVLEFTLSGELRYVDRQAVQWLQLDGRSGWGVERDGCVQQALPVEVTDLFEDLLHIVRVRTEGSDWRRIEITSLIRGPSHRLILRGFGIPDRRGITEARIVMTVEEARFDQAPQPVSWAAAGEDIV